MTSGIPSDRRARAGLLLVTTARAPPVVPLAICYTPPPPVPSQSRPKERVKGRSPVVTIVVVVVVGGGCSSELGKKIYTSMDIENRIYTRGALTLPKSN